MNKITRRDMMLGAAGALACVGAFGWWKMRRPKPVPLGFEVSDKDLQAALSLLEKHPAIDSHAHPGRTFVRGAENLSGKVKLYKALGTFERQTIADMKKGRLGAASFAMVSDFQLLGVSENGLAAVRAFAPGEAYASYKRQLGHMRALQTGGLVRFVDNQMALDKTNADGDIAAILSCEGGDFLEGKVERVIEAANDGLSYITLLHYHTNELGDIMTTAPVHNGLTQAGREIVSMMNETHMLVDIAHASEATAADVLKTSKVPVMCSHTHIKGLHTKEQPGGDVPRFISQALAREIIAAGGVLGAWPVGIGISTLKGFVDRIMELIEFASIDHVILGTDMDANYKPVMERYTKLPFLVAGLKQRGLSEEDLAKFLRKNFLRVWAGA